MEKETKKTDRQDSDRVGKQAQSRVRREEVMPPETSKLNTDSAPMTCRIVAVSLLLTTVATVGVFLMGGNALTISKEIQEGEYYVSVAKEVQPNFEESLSLYTGDTQKVIDYLLDLRPEDKEEEIAFLDVLEELGQDLSLKLDIHSFEDSSVAGGGQVEPSNTIDYEVSFYGSFRDMESFLEELESLSYYIKVSDIRYIDLNGSADDDDKKTPNLNIKIKLYVK